LGAIISAMLLFNSIFFTLLAILYFFLSFKSAITILVLLGRITLGVLYQIGKSA